MIIRQKKDFENFLSRTGLIRQDKIKYYVYWVIKFLNYCNYRPIKPFNQNISPYLEQLEKDERIKEWQVRQAADAVLIYLEQYLCERRNSIPLTINTLIEKQEKSKSAQQSMPWESVLSQFGNNIRLRHYSPRTEKSYRIWIKRFCRFMKSCDPASLKSEDVKKFLSHLATQEKVSASIQNQAFNALLFLFRMFLVRLINFNHITGQKAKSIEFYEKFLDLWKDADLGIVEVEDAKKRLAGLKNH